MVPRVFRLEGFHCIPQFLTSPHYVKAQELVQNARMVSIKTQCEKLKLASATVTKVHRNDLGTSSSGVLGVFLALWII